MVRKKWAVVFDLDDTLYDERDYQYSGYEEILQGIDSLFGVTAFELCRKNLNFNSKDFLGDVCQLLNLPCEVKDSLLWMYRLHAPKITLREGVGELIAGLLAENYVAILTDGRCFSQRQKIKSLGLQGIPAYISEEWGAPKPDVKRFLQIEEDFPACRYIYIGDNPIKDFIAPNSLGWLTVGLKNPRALHSQVVDDLRAELLPNVWLEDLSVLPGILE